MTDNQINVSTPNKNINIGTTTPVENLNTNVSAPSTTANAYVTQDLSRYYSDLAQDYSDLAQDYSDLAMNWAIKMDGPVQGAEHSSKYYATLAKESETLAIESANTAEQNAINTLENANKAIEAKEQAAISATSAVESAQNVFESAEIARKKAFEANASAVNAALSADDASIFSDEASNAATLCVQSTQQAQNSAADAELSAQQAAHAGAGLVPGLLFFSPDPQTDANLYPADGSLIAADGKHSDFVTEYIDPLYNKLSNEFGSNIIVSGDIRLENGIASGFNTDSVLRNRIFSAVSDAIFFKRGWNFSFPFITPSLISIERICLFEAISNNADSIISLVVLNRTLTILFKSNTSSALSFTEFSLEPNTKYIVNGNFTDTSTDGTGGTWVFEVVKDSQTIATSTVDIVPVSSTTKFIKLGGGSTSTTSSTYPAVGYQIDVANCRFATAAKGKIIEWTAADTRFTAEEDFQAQVAANGICDKYVYNQGESVRVPKLGNKLYTNMPDDIPTIGNGYTIGVTDGTTFGGLCSATGTSTPVQAKDVLYATTVGTTNSGTRLSSATIGIPTKAKLGDNPEYSGLIADTSAIPAIEGYWYIVVGTVTKTDIQVDIDNIATDVNGKADKDLNNCTSSFFVDGAIVNAYLLAFDNNTAGTFEIDLSEYLPNDGCKYEIFATHYQQDAGNNTTYINTDLFDTEVLVANIASGSTRNTNTFWLPVGIRRTLSLTAAAACDKNALYFYGYRRLGRNE